MLTVLLATHNGAGTLPRVLEGYTRLQSPEGGWRLVIVDNASTDATAQLLAQFSPLLPLHAMHTERRGKNIALNLGLGHCLGELVVLTDDDAVPDADWLVALQRVARQQPSFDTFGGRIDPLWPDDRCPDWIVRLVNLGATFAITPADMVPGPAAAARVWGPNMAIRMRVFESGHRFDEGVGPAAGQYVMGSEVEFTCRIERAGHRAFYAPDARVAHIIRPHQMEPLWIIGRGYRLGRHMFHQERDLIPPDMARFRGAPRWMWRRFLLETLRAGWGHLRRDFDVHFKADWEVSFLRGYLDEAARHAGLAGVRPR